jgi:hypothetical protein
MFFSYAKAYRLTKNEFFWQMVRSLARGMGLGEIGDKPNSTIIPTSSPTGDTFALCGLLELYQVTDQKDYLILAANLGNKLAQASFIDGFFTMSGGNGLTKIDSSLPVALLHLAAAIDGKNIDLPTLYPNSTSFDPKVIIARRS